MHLGLTLVRSTLHPLHPTFMKSTPVSRIVQGDFFLVETDQNI
jgi:hypothetical protein